MVSPLPTRSCKAVERDLGDSVHVRIAGARLLVRAAVPGVADRLRDLEKNDGGFTAGQRVQLWKALAMLHYSLPADGGRGSDAAVRASRRRESK